MFNFKAFPIGHEKIAILRDRGTEVIKLQSSMLSSSVRKWLRLQCFHPVSENG